MSTRVKHMGEISNELEAIRNEFAALGSKQQRIQTQLDEVNIRLDKVERFEEKIDTVENLVSKSAQIQGEMFKYLMEIETKITHPASPQGSPMMCLAQSVIRDPDKQQQAAEVIQELDKHLEELVQSKLQKFMSDATEVRETTQIPD
uniref:Uncharacterized protein n=1 Tax=Triticum urartu TaxID=4572 RepID=A0A8R7VDD9_TRIUA